MYKVEFKIAEVHDDEHETVLFSSEFTDDRSELHAIMKWLINNDDNNSEFMQYFNKFDDDSHNNRVLTEVIDMMRSR